MYLNKWPWSQVACCRLCSCQCPALFLSKFSWDKSKKVFGQKLQPHEWWMSCSEGLNAVKVPLGLLFMGKGASNSICRLPHGRSSCRGTWRSPEMQQIILHLKGNPSTHQESNPTGTKWILGEKQRSNPKPREISSPLDVQTKRSVVGHLQYQLHTHCQLQGQ